MRPLLPLLLLMCLFTALGCNNRSDDDITMFEEEFGEGELTARIDGRAFSGRVAWAEREENIDGLGLSTLVIVGGDVWGEEDGEAIGIVFFVDRTELPASGSFSMEGECLTKDVPCLEAAYGFSDRDGDIDAAFVSDEDTPGSMVNLTYEIYDRVEGPAIRGSFDMVLVSDDDPSILMEITDGKFDVYFDE
ncbi:hypothetical protein [Lewinella sp. JB7]|uniref:hypothetical protein n=1 Tax=Lewinella sp. JB7 TaxID=2962887 RepID=UPI0020CA2588|nr:hypothetical protein [Lewinella sp. JB7]MCP9236928.1 hypothetical protein [Lewinella sp. JB7]